MFNACSLYNVYAKNFCLYKAYFTISRRVTSLLANLAKKNLRLQLSDHRSAIFR